ncbi:unnamed protein product, partial [marine sediment metagenome]
MVIKRFFPHTSNIPTFSLGITGIDSFNFVSGLEALTETYPGSVGPRDKYGNATCKYRGMPQIKSDGAMRGSFELKGQHGRSALAKFSSSGTYRITAVDKDDGIVGISNPIAVTDKDNNDLNLYGGDLHV